MSAIALAANMSRARGTVPAPPAGIEAGTAAHSSKQYAVVHSSITVEVGRWTQRAAGLRLVGSTTSRHPHACSQTSMPSRGMVPCRNVRSRARAGVRVLVAGEQGKRRTHHRAQTQGVRWGVRSPACLALCALSHTVVLQGSWLAVVTMSRPPVALLYASQPQPEPCAGEGVAHKGFSGVGLDAKGQSRRTSVGLEQGDRHYIKGHALHIALVDHWGLI